MKEVDDNTQDAQLTLGDVLYAKGPATVPETEWAELVHAIAAGNQTALHSLYARAHRPVYTLILRLTSNRATADELTVDVFHDIWRRASTYDPEASTVLGWIMNQARSRALDRLRFNQRKKRTPQAEDAGSQPTPTAEMEDVLERQHRVDALLRALEVLTLEQRQAIEHAYFGDLTYAEVAARLNEPLGTIKTRVRTGLHKLRQALADQGDTL